MSLYPSVDWRCVAAQVIAMCLVLGFAAQTHAADATPEHTRMAAALRQLDALERSVAHCATHAPVAPGERYHFDYPRLLTDLARVRAGIQEHLTPSRAQPRDLSELVGDYRTERAAHEVPTPKGQP